MYDIKKAAEGSLSYLQDWNNVMAFPTSLPQLAGNFPKNPNPELLVLLFACLNQQIGFVFLRIPKC